MTVQQHLGRCQKWQIHRQNFQSSFKCFSLIFYNDMTALIEKTDYLVQFSPLDRSILNEFTPGESSSTCSTLTSLKFKPNAMLCEDPKTDLLLAFSLLFRMLMISCTAENEIPKFLAIVRLLSYLLVNQQGLLVMLEFGFVVATSQIITEKIYIL